ncbi:MULTISPECIES: response regulator transcription factor [Streptomyces]|uniref:response regulator transcription factor n=1 Tax=Streptomyces TaxID=1883 RepID=UPI00345C56B0
MTRIPRHGTPLTQRERQVLAGLTRGIGGAGIGRELGITHDTVKTHTVRIYAKLGARDAAHAVAIGYRRRILVLEPFVTPDRSGK